MIVWRRIARLKHQHLLSLSGYVRVRPLSIGMSSSKFMNSPQLLYDNILNLNYFPTMTKTFQTAIITSLCLLAAHPFSSALTFTIPNKVGTGDYFYTPLDPAPIGISFEFFAFPSYFTNVTATQQCLANWKAQTGVWPPIRIGGTTQDRAQYDSNTSAYVVYSVANAKDAPSALTFGSKFMTLAGTYEGSVVVGLNRGKNEIENTIAAAKVAVSEVKNLLAIELGNEPECEMQASTP